VRASCGRCQRSVGEIPQKKREVFWFRSFWFKNWRPNVSARGTATRDGSNDINKNPDEEKREKGGERLAYSRWYQGVENQKNKTGHQQPLSSFFYKTRMGNEESTRQAPHAVIRVLSFYDSKGGGAGGL